MSTTPMTALGMIELKKSTDTLLAPAAFKYLKRVFGKATAEEFTPFFQQLDTLRGEVIRINVAQTPSILRLLAYIEKVAYCTHGRLPFGSPKFDVKYTWYDAFFPAKKMVGADPAYDEAALLFNAGALSSRIGAAVNLGSDDGVQVAAAALMQAAGYFTACRDFALSNPTIGAPTPDMTPQCLDMLTALQLARAQACFVIKAQQNGMAPAITAKLSEAVAQQYDLVFSALKLPALRGVFPDSTVTLMRYDATMYRVRAHLAMVDDAVARDEHGLAIAQGRAAMGLLASITDKALGKPGKSLTAQLKRERDAMAAKIEDQLPKLEYKNDMLHHQAVPHESKVKIPCQARLLVAPKLPANYPTPAFMSEADPLRKLVPEGIAKLQEMFASIMGASISELESEAFKAVSTVRAIVEGELSLPSALAVAIEVDHALSLGGTRPSTPPTPQVS
jgi:programmed cell death 6-interacting protein